MCFDHKSNAQWSLFSCFRDQLDLLYSVLFCLLYNKSMKYQTLKTFFIANRVTEDLNPSGPGEDFLPQYL